LSKVKNDSAVWFPVILILAGSLAVLHFFWRATFRRAQAAAAREIESLQQSRQQAALQHQTQQQAIYNSMVEGLLLLDEGGRIQLANRAFAKLFGVANAVTGKTVLEVLRLHELAELVEQLGPEQPWVSRELKIAGGGELSLQVSAAAVLGGDGQRQGTILVFHDVTRLKQLERTREEFVANVSHELRTPLSHIRGYVETLLGGAKDDPEVATRFLQTIERNAGRLQSLIEDLLTISELESGRVTLNLQTVSLRAVMEKVREDFQTRAAAKAITLSNEVVELTVRADVGRLEQVVSNLVDNAIKYGRSGGRVVLGGRATGDGQTEVFVQDDGPGLPAETLERVFERFYRVDKARSREQGGTGLGLAIVKHLVQSHGGKVWVRSEVGHGATFHFTLPLSA
jgi:two-component system phosphate regulon sensor histidine kinase PhoR